jgi:alkanesulfonate monooxygenase SsuD/methylene tetrahydromethanopterin reductase-like flavin-dependent oxidoreductase (luciferase family)
VAVGFGYRVPQYDSTWEELERCALLAEELGFDGVWLNDHWVPGVHSGRYERPTFECWTAAGALARVTSRIRIGFMTLCNAYRPPQIATKMATSLDVISNGRTDVGMGAGHHVDEFRMYGIPYPEAKVRLDRLEEGLQIMRGMFEHERFSFSGEHYTVDGAWNNPRPVQKPRPPIWIGGVSPRMLRIAARYGDWHNCVLTPLADFEEKMAALDAACEQIGRDPKTLGRSTNPGLLVRETEEEFDELAGARAKARGVSREEYLGLLESQGTIFGGPERVTAMLRAFVDAGCSYFEFIVRERDQESGLRCFGELVLEGFR